MLSPVDGTATLIQNETDYFSLPYLLRRLFSAHIFPPCVSLRPNPVPQIWGMHK